MNRFPIALRLAAGVSALVLLALLAGFFAFCALLPRAGAVPHAALDAVPVDERGMIIFTGARGERIVRGLSLQRDGLADRALISGVNPSTSKRDLVQMGDGALLDCCVDLGLWARSTRGNALESRDWLRARGYRMAVLVTSDFHLPRAMAELRRAVPEVTVVGIPVASDLAPATGWMGRLSAWRLLAEEYAKYLVVRIRSVI